MSMFHSSDAPSDIIKSKGSSIVTDDGLQRQSKEDYKKMKELEEARKAGTAPAQLDEEGKDLNPHIPQFITTGPWYAGVKGMTLKHQRPHPEREKTWSGMDEWYQKGVSNKIATKFRKGACENCGSLTHKMKDCFERPRKIGARFTNEDIAPDEHLQPKLKQTWDAKRDRWNGYDAEDYRETIEEYGRLEQARKLLKADKMREEQLKVEQELKEKEEQQQKDEEAKAEEEKEKQTEENKELTGENMELTGENKELTGEVNVTTPTKTGTGTISTVDTMQEDEDKYAEHADMAGVTVDMDSRTRITVRNLRIREDTAKYLYNLDMTSAYYDPKSRSMRENPFEGKSPAEVPFGGENYARFSGEVLDVNNAQLFAWEANKRGVDVHTLAEPTKLEVLKKDVLGKKSTHKDVQKQAILEKYGGEEYLERGDLLPVQSESYIEYSRSGKVLKGAEKQINKSRYIEDILLSNHTLIWGSFFKEGQWGFACCHSTVKQSYCTGEAGKQSGIHVQMEKELQKPDTKDKSGSSSVSSSSSSNSSSSSEESENEEMKVEKQKKREQEKLRIQRKEEANRKRRAKKKSRKLTQSKNKKKDSPSSSDSSDDSDVEPETKRIKKRAKGDESLKDALIKITKAERKGQKLAEMDDRNRPFNKNYETKAPTDLEMEAYRMTRQLINDPMNQFKK